MLILHIFLLPHIGKRYAVPNNFVKLNSIRRGLFKIEILILLTFVKKGRLFGLFNWFLNYIFKSAYFLLDIFVNPTMIYHFWKILELTEIFCQIIFLRKVIKHLFPTKLLKYNNKIRVRIY